MVQFYNENDSGSDSDGSHSRSPSPQIAPTPGHSLEHHDSVSNSPRNSVRSHSPDNSENELQIDDGSERPNSRYRSHSPQSDAYSNKSGSPARSHTSKSRSATPTASHPTNSKSPRAVSRSQSRSPSHASRSPSQHSHASRSRSRSGGSRSSRSRSRSGSAKSRKSRSGSRDSNNVVQGQRSRSGSRTGSDRSRSRSRSRSGSRRSKSGSRSRSQTPSKGSRGVSVARSTRSGSAARSRSGSRNGGDSPGKRQRNLLNDSGSDDDKNATKKKRSALIDSDSEDEPTNADSEGVDAGALFGDADDISSDENEADGKRTGSEENDKRADSDKESDRRSERRSSGSEDERDAENEELEKEAEPEPEPIPERRIDVEIPRIVTDLGKEIHFVKLPNFLSVDTRPFDAETYEDEIDEEETLDEEGRQRIKLKVSNTIRWREQMNNKGEMIRESNARMIKWSDGSMSLHLGNEIFDVYKQSLHGDHNHLFIRQGTGLQGQAVFRTKLTFRPHSTESFTHKKMTMSLADRSQKTSGIKILTQVGYNPDTDRLQNLKKEEEKLRQAIRQRASTSKPKRSRDTSSNVHTSYREDGDHESDDEGAISIAAIKNKYKKQPTGGAGGHQKAGAAIYSSDEEDSDLDTRRSKKVDKTKALKALRESDDEDDDDDGAVGGHDSGSDVGDKSDAHDE